MDEDARRFQLCEFCLRRQAAGKADVVPAREGEDCFICGGISTNLSEITKRMVSRLDGFEFRTFSVGIVLPPGIQEREDTLRSDLKMRGGETVKSELARRLAESVVKSLRGKRVDRLHPDVVVLVDVGEGMVAVTSKPLFVYGRYTKPRGVPQRKLFCEKCNGRGCDRCNESGYALSPSVEGLVSKRLGVLLGSKKFKFTWFGSEDADSVVFPPGRPFVIESKSPRRRHPPRQLRIRTGAGGMSVSGVRVVARHFERPAFTFMTRAVIKAERRVSMDDVKRLQANMRNTLVQYRNNKGRLVNKRIYYVRASARGKRVTADIKLDGGLPVKRLVSGEAVSPSFAESMQMALRCERFDIVKVWPRLGAAAKKD